MIEKMEGKEAMELFKVVKSNNLLPAKIDGLVPLSFIGEAAVGYYRKLISHMDELGMTEKQRKATLRDGQDAGELLLDIEARIGEIVDKEERAKPIQVRDQSGKHQNGSIPSGKPPKHERLGMREKQMRQSKTIHKNPEMVERVKAQARENEDIPTKTAVLAEIRFQKEKDRRKKAEANRKPNRVSENFQMVAVESAVDRMLLACPKKWPKVWDEATLKRVQAKAKIIIKRLEVLYGSETKNLLE